MKWIRVTESVLSKLVILYRNSFAGIHPHSYLLAMVQLINRSGTMVVPFMSMYMTQHHGVSISKAGIVMACFGAGSIVGSFIGGKLTDRFGFYWVMVGSLGLGGLSYLLLSMLNNYVLICMGTFLCSVLNEAFRPAGMTAIGAYSNPESLTRSSSLVRQSVNLGWALGAAIGGWFASINYHWLFYADGITCLAAAIMVLLILPNVNNKKPQLAPVSASQIQTSAYRDIWYLKFAGLTCLFAVCFFQLFTTLPVYFKQQLLLSEFAIGSILALNGLIILLFEMVTIYKLELKSPMRLIAWGTFIVGVSFVFLNILPLRPMALALICIIAFSIGEILAMPFMLSITLQRAGNERIGQYTALYTIAYSIAHIAGSTSGGFIADYLSFTALWWIIGAVCALAAFGFHRLQQS